MDSNTPEINAVPEPISQERLISLFEKKEWKYYVDSEGDLGGTWDDDVFYFLLRGEDKEILHITSRWHISLDPSKLEDVRTVIDDWNRERYWPKCYYRIDDDGRIHVHTENTIDWEKGVTEDQLSQQLSCAIGTAGQLYEKLNSEFGI